MNRGQKLTRVRAQVMLVHKLKEQLKMMNSGLRSPVLTDMPKHHGETARGLDVQMARKDALERILARESARLCQYERLAREEMDMMKPEMYAFCTMYYLSGLDLEESAQAIDRSVRQCVRYRKEIEESEKAGESTRQNGRKCHLDSGEAGVL